MESQQVFKVKLLVRLVLGSLLVIGAEAALAQDAVDLGQVQTSADSGVAAGGSGDVQSASYQAPTQTSLKATEPQSIINQHYIEENAPAGANYTDIVSIAPSVVDMAPNGPGLMESGSGGGTPTLRGFQDGHYNVTFDGIPWGDSNDFTHHSTTYFMSQDIGQVVVDRGPGDASSIGNATYGGTIALSSKEPLLKQQTKVYGTYGSWNTRLLGAEYDSGLKNDGRFYGSIKDMNSDGFLTNSGQARWNGLLKYQKLLSNDTTLTALAMFNHVLQHVPNGATPQQLATYGYNFGLVNDGQSEANSGWNYDKIDSDFEYVDLNSKLNKWTLDNKLYTYAYYHRGYYGANTGSVTLADTINDGGTTNGASNVPGTQMRNNYRSYGDLLRSTYDLGRDKIELGLWYDHQWNDRWEQQIDWTANMTPNLIVNYPGGTTGSVDRDMHNDLDTFQGYAQYVWNVTPRWTITPGLKYDYFKRTIDAAINQKTLLPYSASKAWDKLLSSINARYKFTPNLSAYAEYSEGFLAPNMNVFYKKNIDLGSVDPTTTKNYQIGSNWASRDLNLGVDLYQIDATNMAFATACPAGYTSCAQLLPSVRYSGFELEGTYMFTPGWSIYANYANNNYSDSSNTVLQNSPKNNAALGLIHQDGNLYASIMTKYIGTFYSNTDASGNNLRFSGYTLTNFNLSYKLPNKAKVGFAIDNLFDKKGYLTSMSSDVNGNPLYFVIPSRSYQLSLSMKF